MSSSPFCLEHVIEGNTAKAFRAIFEHYARDQYCGQPILSYQNYVSLLRAIPGVSDTPAHHQRNSTLFYSYIRQGLSGLLLDDFLAVVVDLSMDMYGKNNEGPMVALTHFLTHNLFKIQDLDTDMDRNTDSYSDYAVQGRATRRRMGGLGVRSRSVSNTSQARRYSFSSDSSQLDRNYPVNNMGTAVDSAQHNFTSNLFGFQSNSQPHSTNSSIPYRQVQSERKPSTQGSFQYPNTGTVPIFPLLGQQTSVPTQESYSNSIPSHAGSKYNIAPRTLSFQDSDLNNPFQHSSTGFGQANAPLNNAHSHPQYNTPANQFNPLRIPQSPQSSPKNTYPRSQLVPPMSPVPSISRSSSIQSIDRSPYFASAKDHNNVPSIPTLSLLDPALDIAAQPHSNGHTTNLVRSSSNASTQSKTSRSTSAYSPRPLPSRSSSAASMPSHRVPRSSSNLSQRSTASRASVNSGQGVPVVASYHSFPSRASSAQSTTITRGRTLTSLPLAPSTSLVSAYSVPMQKELMGSPVASTPGTTTPSGASVGSPILKGESILSNVTTPRDLVLSNPSRSPSTDHVVPSIKTSPITIPQGALVPSGSSRSSSVATSTPISSVSSPALPLSGPPALRRLSLYTDPSTSVPSPQVLSANEAPDATLRNASTVIHPSPQPLFPRERGRHRSVSHGSVGSFNSPMTKPSGSVDGEPGSNTTPNVVGVRRSDSVDSMRSDAGGRAPEASAKGQVVAKGPYRAPSGRNIRDPLPSPPLHFVAETTLDGKPTNAEPVVYKPTSGRSNRMMPASKLKEMEDERREKVKAGCGRWALPCCRWTVIAFFVLFSFTLLVCSGLLYLLYHDSVPLPLQSHPLVTALAEGVLPSVRYFFSSQGSSSSLPKAKYERGATLEHSADLNQYEHNDVASYTRVDAVAVPVDEEIQWDFSNGYDISEL